VCFWITLYDIENVFYTRFYRIDLRLTLTILQTQLFSLHFSLRKFFFKVFKCFFPLVIRSSSLASVPFDLILHLIDLLLQTLDLVTQVVHELKQCKILLLSLYECVN